jgi:hypothetical protein
MTQIVVAVQMAKPVFKFIKRTALIQRGEPTEVFRFSSTSAGVMAAELDAKLQQINA